MDSERSTPINVLLIEDNPADARLIKEILAESRVARFNLQWADRLATGLERLDSRTVDVVLLDLSLPDSQGFDTFSKALARVPEIPIVVLTGLDDETVATRAVQAGAQDYLAKGQLDGRGLARAISYAIERKRGEKALRDSERRFIQLIESMPVAVFVVDADGKPWYMNKMAVCLLKKGLAEIDPEVRVGQWSQSHQAYLAGTDQFYPQERSPLARALAGESSTVDDMEIRHPDEKILLEMSATPIRNEQGEIIYAIAAFDDITDRKRMEAQFLQAQKMETVGRLAGGVAHDFNNLLTVITGYAGFIRDALGFGSPLRDDIDQVLKAAERATTLTQRLLAFSRRQIIAMQVVNLNDLILDMDRMLGRVISEDMELVTLPAPDLGMVKVDPHQIEQVLVNLAVNARDAMPGGGKLTIETANVTLDESYALQHVSTAPGEYVMLAVSDTGTGMTPEVKAHLFEPFFTTKEVGKGTGLGLAMVYGTVKQHNGDVQVYSEPGQGTTFKIYLPRVDEVAEQTVQPAEVVRAPKGHETILVVEDEPTVRGLALRILHQQGYTVLEAANGKAALRLAREHSGEIHLLMTDVVMPQMSGQDLAGQLKAIRLNLKVLYVSGYTDNAIVHHGTLDKGTAFLQKPFTVNALVHKVRQVLDEYTLPD